MIKSNFRIGGDIIEVIVRGNELLFTDDTGTITTLDGLRISRAGVLKEFPELKDNKQWKKIALERLKSHVKKQKTELDKTNYVKDELIKYGYEPMFYQRAGWRPQKFK